MTSKEALEKLDHTICLNTGIKWGVDDLDKIDCQTQEEAIECIDTIRKDLKIIKQAQNQCENQEKLLNILKEKCEIDSCFIRDTRDYKDYLRLAKKLLREAYILTIDEYKILKKWLKND